MNNTIIVGLTGPFGSGCTYVAREHMTKFGYNYLSLSSILKEEFIEQGGKELDQRNELQEFGNKLRKEKGYDYLAKKVFEKIEADKSCKKWVVDSIRNTHEVEFFRKKAGQFFLISVWADKITRWERVSNKYKNNQQLFNEDDKRDSNENIENGQQISLCYQMADVVVLNDKKLHVDSDDYNSFNRIIKRYVNMFEGAESFIPTEDETLMTMAYTNSWRSSCTQRKVGALIRDDFGNVFSSGYNEVPSSERSCKKEYGKCYRKYLRDIFNSQVDEILYEQDKREAVKKLFKKEFKILDYCRALHAEENAIINIARLGVSFPMERATLYTTTYPCNLCANKIAQVGIKKIVYFEPYPMEEAKNILSKHRIEQKPFEGVTYNGYSRLMEVLR